MDHGWHGNMSLMANGTGLSMAATDGNSTFEVINEFKFLAARSIRTSTIILSVFNTVSAFATAAGILFDCYLKAKRSGTRPNQKFNIFKCVRGTETFPFVLSLGITVQGIIFAVAQSHGLDGLFKAGCSLISQFMWPAIFIVPYIQLVFGLEVTIRGLRTKPFPTRGKWDVVICLVIIKILLVVTGLVAFFIRAPNFCFASLFWFVARWAEGAFALLLLIAVVLALCITFIYVKLTRYSTIETSERVGASRMLYYLVVAVLSNALMIPFFISLTFTDPMDGGSSSSLTLATIASVVANLSGLLTGGLYLFLRSSTISTIGPKDKVSEYERQKLKYNIRLQGQDQGQDPDTMELDGSIVQRAPSAARSLRVRGSRDDLIAAAEKRNTTIDPGYNSNPLNSNPFNANDFDSRNSYAVFGSAEATTPRAPEPAARPRSRRPSTSYSLFPSEQPQQQQQQPNSNSNLATLLPSTTYTPESTVVAGLPEPGFLFVPDSANTLAPPGFRRHRRDSSLASHATVQIGLRFSNVNDIGPGMTSKNSMEAERVVHTLDCPQPPPPPQPQPESFLQRPSPLTREQQQQQQQQQQRGASFVSSAYTADTDADAYTDDGSERPLTLDTAMASDILKSLPPLPAQPSPTRQQQPSSSMPTITPRASGPTLSPSVYTPPGTAITTSNTRRIASPRGVGFGVPRRTNTTPEPSVTVPAPLRIRGYSDAEKGRGEWI